MKNKNKGPDAAPAPSRASVTPIVCTLDELIYPTIKGFPSLVFRRGVNQVSSDHLDALISAGFGGQLERHLTCGYLEFQPLAKEIEPEASPVVVTQSDDELIATVRATYDLQLLDSVFNAPGASLPVQNACIQRSSELDNMPQGELEEKLKEALQA